MVSTIAHFYTVAPQRVGPTRPTAALIYYYYYFAEVLQTLFFPPVQF